MSPNYRSRLVAREFNDGTPSIFAATPPLECLKILFGLAASEQSGKRVKRKLAFIDIRKAHLYARMLRDAYIDLPPGDEQDGYCGKLNYTLYGTRDAAHNWEIEYTGTLQELGSQLGNLLLVFSGTINGILT